jgi:amidase
VKAGAVTGPVYVDGAEPGDALAVTIHDIELAEKGWSVYTPGAGALAHAMGSGTSML